jgi:hypothetical protein
LKYFNLHRQAGTICCEAGRSHTIWEIPGVFQLNDEGMHMPVFTFEKISSLPRRPAPPPGDDDKKHRGVIIQFIDRLVESRKRSHDDGVIARHEPFPPK